MKEKRAFHKEHISAFHQQQEQKLEESKATIKTEINLPCSSNDDIENTFKEIVLPKKRKLDDLYKNKKKPKRIRDENYIPYLPADRHTEEGYVRKKVV